jgi:hypothetical protein
LPKKSKILRKKGPKLFSKVYSRKSVDLSHLAGEHLSMFDISGINMFPYTE